MVRHDGFGDVTHLLTQGVENGCFPGAVLAVGYAGQLVFEMAVGSAALMPEARRMTVGTTFDLASLTKPLATATALMGLVAASRVSLEAPVNAYLPTLAAPPHSAPTLRHLLTHSAGLPAWCPFYRDIQPDSPQLERRRQVYDAAHRVPLLTPAGTAVCYSDIGFILLGEVIEVISGVSLDEFCATAVFGALDLPGIHFRNTAQPQPSGAPVASTEACPWRGRVLNGEVHDENAWIMGGVAGHAGLFATARDLWRFAQGLVDGWHGRPWLVSTATLHAFLQRQGLPSGSTWALGWDTPTPGQSSAGRYFSPTAIGHVGFTGTSLWIDLARRLIVVLLTNRVHPSRRREGIKAFRPALHDAVMQALGLA
jgi:CubicO group peptidase (beta-lactamase class C family)